MIRINLLPQRRSSTTEKGKQSLLTGVLALILLCAGIYFLVHRPLVSKLATQENENAAAEKENTALKKKLKDSRFEEMKRELAAEDQRTKLINNLQDLRLTPVFYLRELGTILTPDRQPTIAGKVKSEFDDRWNAKNVWVLSFQDKGGTFMMKASAQSKREATEFAERLGSSVYFNDVRIPNLQETTDNKSKIEYSKFDVTGKVVY